MTPVVFPQANIMIGPPAGMDESQVASIPAFRGVLNAGNLDGQEVIVVAWDPSDEDIKNLIDGNPVYLTVFGGLPPHSIATEFPF